MSSSSGTLSWSNRTLKDLGRSGALVQGVCDLGARDVEIRALVVWQTLARVLSNVGVHPSEELAEDLKGIIRQYIPQITSFPTQCLDRTTQATGIGIRASLSDARDRALMKVYAEIDLFVLSLLKRAEAQEGRAVSPQPIFNIYSPVGAIQTGPSATASVVLTVGSQDRDAFLKALDLVKEGLARVENLAADSKAEVLDLVEEAKGELEKPKANSLRLRSVLTAVATAIQTAGSLQPAYQALKSALLSLGIQLP